MAYHITTMARIKSLWKFAILAAVSFASGRSWRMLLKYQGSDNLRNGEDTDVVAHRDFGLQDQVQAQVEIQRTIGKPLADCNVKRIMATDLVSEKDGFASEFQYVARLLQMAVSSTRLLVLKPNFTSAYEPMDCTSSGWECLWEPVSSCPPVNISHFQSHPSQWSESSQTLTSDLSPLGFGVDKMSSKSTFFDVAWYGSNTLAWSPISFSRREGRINLRADVIPHWERAYGRFWIRSQMAHYLWKPNGMLQAQIDARFPPAVARDNVEPFIGFHVRYSDNVRDLKKGFARDANISRSLSHFMEIAQDIRTQNPERHLSHIYLSTDNSKVVEQSKQPHWEKLGWKFIMQADVQRSTSQERMWFREGRKNAAGAIATDIEVLRRADFLVGSFQSNVYRLACQLNSAWQVKKYALDMQRHYAVDVEWYEDP